MKVREYHGVSRENSEHTIALHLVYALDGVDLAIVPGNIDSETYRIKLSRKDVHNLVDTLLLMIGEDELEVQKTVAALKGL